MATVIRSAGERWLAMRRALGLRLSQRLFDEIAHDPDRLLQKSAISGMSWSLILAYLMATIVYVISLTFGVLGVFLLIEPWDTVLTPFISVILVLLCMASRPRVVAPPYNILSRTDFPTLYALADRVASAMGAKKVDGIAKSADFNANYRQAGWKNKRYVELGAPLLAILTYEQRIAVIAHELSHGANGDPLRRAYLHGAVNTLVVWARAIRPTEAGSSGNGMPFGPLLSLVAIPFEILMLLLSELVFLLVKGFYLLVLRQSQRAEYLADRLAASVAGSDEMRSALEKLYLEETVASAIRSHAWTSPKDPIGARLARAVLKVTPEQMEELRTESQASQWQVDSTHPPTALRVEMLRLSPVQRSKSLLTPGEIHTLNSEIGCIIAWSQRELLNRQFEEDSGY